MNPQPPSPPPAVTPSAGDSRSLRMGLGGALDRDSADLLVTAAARQLADHPGTTELRLDCAAITSCDAMGLSALLMIRRLAGEAGARIRLEGGSVCLDRLLEVTGTREHLVAAPLPGTPGGSGPGHQG
ncbi:STAS domain-containing protein [Streptomyces sp. NPDC054842]